MQFREKNNHPQAYDVLIIGDSLIHAHLTRELALLGKRVALVCPKDFAAGSKQDATLKGLLKGNPWTLFFNFFRIVYEINLLHKNAPHLFFQDKVDVPYRNVWGALSKVFFLKGFYWVSNFLLDTTFWKGGIRLLAATEDNQSALLITDGKVSYARLFIELVLQAELLGATVINYGAYKDAYLEQKKLSHLVIQNDLNKQRQTIEAEVLIMENLENAEALKGVKNVLELKSASLALSRWAAIKTIRKLRFKSVKKGRVNSESMPYLGGEILDQDVYYFKNFPIEKKIFKISEPLYKHLINHYGSMYHKVLSVICEKPAYKAFLPGLDHVAGEVIYAIRYEHAKTLDDFFSRRIHVTFPSEACINEVVACFKEELKLTETESVALSKTFIQAQGDNAQELLF